MLSRGLLSVRKFKIQSEFKVEKFLKKINYTKFIDQRENLRVKKELIIETIKIRRQKNKTYGIKAIFLGLIFPSMEGAMKALINH